MSEDIVITLPDVIVISAETQLVLLGVGIGLILGYVLLMYAIMRREYPGDSRVASLMFAVVAIGLPHQLLPEIVEAAAEYDIQEPESAEDAGGKE